VLSSFTCSISGLPKR